MPRAIRGILVECEPSIKSIIINIDRQNHDYIIEDLDETHLVIKENMLVKLKIKIEDMLKDSYQVVPLKDDVTDEEDLI
ncbi:nucleotide excision repair, TFIIH, subunit [Coniochaeta ligniaria NRRL 30616]|uniref:General transcription and DNA repair factor IIH subunit TFB5 n=1 Tax=Coniochaeta ligniaria NRRL 30616 TaxID=1408157 RepID=A0A1J7IP70_9PEZI|nr:nucleotide excision repair, TFIIH, subunit [Coniochaeta ligniaria NRRL 30616]